MNDNNFWQFSIKLYQICQPLMLNLQNKANLNVNMILFCCWQANAANSLKTNHIKASSKIANAYEKNFTKTIRQLRKQTKSLNNPELYQQIKQTELAFENQTQAELYNYAKQNLTQQRKSNENLTNLAKANLQTYIKYAKKDSPAAWIDEAINAICENLTKMDSHQ